MNVAIGIAGSLVGQAPVLIVWLVGLVFGLIHLKTHRRPATYLLTGLLLLLVIRLAQTALMSWLPLYLVDSGTPHSELGFILLGVSAGLSLFAALGWGFIIAAVFVERGGQQRAEG